jgi:hypothetical protein
MGGLPKIKRASFPYQGFAEIKMRKTDIRANKPKAVMPGP